jgi:hypothetical protein
MQICEGKNLRLSYSTVIGSHLWVVISRKSWKKTFTGAEYISLGGRKGGFWIVEIFGRLS